MGLIKKIFKRVGKLLGGVLKGVLGWLVPKPEGKDGLLIERQGSDLPIPIVYGTTQIGCIKVHKYVTDTPQEAWNDLLHIIAVFCEGEVDAVEELFFNGVSENDPRWKKGNEKWFKKYVYLGTPDQPASAQAVSGIPNWTINHKLSGLCYVYLVLQMDSNLEVWQGEPEITARIRGRKVLDTRTGVTAYSENPAMILRDYLTNTVYGKGLPPQRIDTAVFNAVANQCDEQITFDATFTEYFEDNTVPGKPVLVPVTTTQTITKAKFKTNIFLDTANSVFDNVGELLSTFRGIMPLSSGLIKISIETTGSPVFELNDDNIIGDVDFSGGSVNDRLNRVEVRFPNKAKGYEKDSVIYPTAGDPILATWLDEDNGVVLNKSFEIDGITNKDEAIQAAIVIAKRSRFTKSIELTAMPDAIVLEPGDIVGVTLEGFGFQSKPFRVAEKIIDEDDNIQLTLTEHENNVYPWTGLNYDDVLGGTFLGDPTRLNAPTGLTITPDLTYATSGTLAWNYQQNAFVRKFRVVVNRENAVIFDIEVLGQNWSIPKLDAGSYSIQVYAVGTTGYQSDAAAIAMTLAVPVPPSDIVFNASNFEIEARPVLAGAGLGTQFEFDCVEGDGSGHTPQSKARGATATFVGLKHGTLYTVFARTINALGISEWVIGSIETTADAGPIIDLIGEDINATIFQPIVEELQNEFNAVTEAINQDVANLNDEVVLIETDLANFKTTAFENERELKLRISREEVSRIESDKQLFNTTAEAVRLRNIASEIRGAVFDVDPESGTITLKAFNYADSKFAEAAVLIDGVNASVAIQANRITNTEQRITQAESELIVQAGQISLKASFTDVNEAIAGVIDAILPAYSFGFFNSAEGWSAVNGAITGTNQKLSLTWGDITNQSLSYLADENPLISISILRTAGSGWTGDLIVTYSDNSTVTYTAVIEDIPTGTPFVRNLNLAGESSYTGTVTGLRLVLGASTDDEFEISAITVGKPSAALIELEGITAQVNQLGIEIDAVEGSLSSYVATAFYDANTVTLNNVETVLDGTEAIISLRATQTYINDQDTIEKANVAAIWVDAAEANITSVVESFNAQPGGIDDQLGTINENFTIVQNEIDAVEGLARTQAVSINRIKNSSDQQGKEQLQSEYELYLAKRNLLEVGASIATAEFSIQALAEADQALAQSILDLSSSTGTQLGQLNANLQQVNTTLTNQISAVSQSVTDLSVSLGNEIDAAVQRLDQAELGIDGNASAIASVQGVVNNPTTGLAATFTLAQAAKSAADGNTNSLTLLSNQVSSLNQDIASTAQLAQQTAILADNTSSSLTTLTNTVNNASTGLAATNTLAQQAKTTADGNASSIATLQGAVNNPTNGLSATFTLAQAAKTASDGNTSSITTINNTINNSTTGLSATFTLATTANNRSQSNQTAIAGLQTQVTSIDGDLSQAELLLQSTVNELDQVSARAFLGVTTVTAGSAVINGIVVDGATNTLEFRGNTLRWTDISGNLQLYASAETGKLIYNGDMVAGTFQTATSGFRAEMSGTGMFPFWYGANAKTLENALFAVDNGGNVTIRNATVRGGLVTSDGTGIRNEVVNDGTYLQWVGSGAKNDANAVFFLKTNGNAYFAGDLRDGASSSSGYSVLTNQLNLTRNVETTIATVVIPAIAGKVISIQVIVNGTTFGASGTGQTYNTVIRIRRNGALVASKTQPGLFSDYEVVRLFLDNPGAGTFTYTLTVQCNITDGDNPANETINVKYAALATQQLRR